MDFDVNSLTFLGTEKLPEKPVFFVSAPHVENLSKISRVINSSPSDETLHTSCLLGQGLDQGMGPWPVGGHS